MGPKSNSWCLIESDPAVFTEIIQKIGVVGVSVEDLLMLDTSSLEKYERVYGLVLLFKWQSKDQAAPLGNVVADAPVFFARQVIDNACATLAIVNTLCNFEDAVNVGPVLQNYLGFTKGMDPEMRGSLLDNLEELKEAHNSFAPPTSFVDEGPSPEDADAFHFVSFIFRQNHIWELDGLQEGPIQCREATEATYKSALVEVAQQRIEDISAKDTKGSGQGIFFSLMAIVDDPVVNLEKEIARLKAEEKPTTMLEEELADMKASRQKDTEVNQRRRHNYDPMIVELLKALAAQGKLEAIIEEVQSKKKASPSS